MAANNKKPDYSVGKGKPPKHTQFKPGQSGNPNPCKVHMRQAE